MRTLSYRSKHVTDSVVSCVNQVDNDSGLHSEWAIGLDTSASLNLPQSTPLGQIVLRLLLGNVDRYTESVLYDIQPYRAHLPKFQLRFFAFSFRGTRAKLDDGTQSYLRDVSRSICETALPEDEEELQAAVEAVAGDRGAATGGGGTRGAGGDSARSIMETASRLAQLKSGVLEPMLCQVLTQQVVG